MTFTCGLNLNLVSSDTIPANFDSGLALAGLDPKTPSVIVPLWNLLTLILDKLILLAFWIEETI